MNARARYAEAVNKVLLTHEFMSVEAIAKVTKLSRHQVNHGLATLRSKGLAAYEKRGRNALWKRMKTALKTPMPPLRQREENTGSQLNGSSDLISVRVNVGGKHADLTIKEARRLRDTLNQLLGNVDS